MPKLIIESLLSQSVSSVLISGEVLVPITAMTRDVGDHGDSRPSAESSDGHADFVHFHVFSYLLA